MLIMLSRQSFFSVAILQFHAFLFGLQKKQTEKLSSISLGGWYPSGTLWGCLHGGRNILAPGTSWKADHPNAICFLYSVHTQRAVLVPNAWIFLTNREQDPSTRNILESGSS